MIKKVLSILILGLSLQGCIFVAGAAAGAAAIAVVYDHRKLEAVLLDQHIVNEIVQKIKVSPDLNGDNTHISVSCFNKIVLLTGQTTTPALREQAEDIARNTQDVTRVYNELSVKGPTSSLTRTSDAWITAKIKTQMLATTDLKSGTIKVVTENGTVYLMGMVTHAQADMAVDIARQVAGVQKVIKIFQYTD
jgi:osmotically-inducible protein OsmY